MTIEKDYFKDRHPNCKKLKAVQDHLYIEHGDVYICEKAMQTIASDLSDLTRVTILAILSNDDHPMGLKVKGMDEFGHIKIGRITYFIFNECILTVNGLIPIDQVLYKGYYFFNLKLKINKIKNYLLDVRLDKHLYFYKEEELDSYLKAFDIEVMQLFPKLLYIKTKEKEYKLNSCDLTIRDRVYKNIKIETIFHQIKPVLLDNIIQIELLEIEKKQVN